MHNFFIPVKKQRAKKIEHDRVHKYFQKLCIFTAEQATVIIFSVNLPIVTIINTLFWSNGGRGPHTLKSTRFCLVLRKSILCSQYSCFFSPSTYIALFPYFPHLDVHSVVLVLRVWSVLCATWPGQIHVFFLA